MSNKACVVGVGMIPFKKPGASGSYIEMGAEATRAALADAGLAYDKLQQAYAGYCFGGSTSGQSALYEVGVTGIPIINVNNNCSTGSTALYLARQAVESGAVDCALALGFEQMRPGALGGGWDDRPPTLGKARKITDQLASDVPVIGLTKALAKEWGRMKVTVNAVAFGFILTRMTEATADSNATIKIEGRDIKVGIRPEMAAQASAIIPLGRPGTPDDAAGAVYLLCIPESNYVSGQTLICGGGHGGF